ncbi:MAG: peptidase C1 [Brevundimonas sp.]|nr:MAG: peptidase C1 [Brevundimonas sp.]
MSHSIVFITDLRARLGSARDQGPRPTCLAFAASDLHAAIRPGWDPLSCEAAFFHAQRRAGRPPSVGATLPSMLEALTLDGQPIEAAWPYLAETPIGSGAWTPPSFSEDVFKRSGSAVTPGWSHLTDLLNAGKPVLLLMTLSPSFFRPVQGLVEAANDEAPDPTLRHAVLAVAHGAVDGKAAVLVRNSWGESWGAAGHAWLTADFVTARLFGMALLNEDENVSSHSIAA